MKKYLKISNKGALEIEALTLVGASSKRGDNSNIGMFGSGNKYALAYLMRNNYNIQIFSDNTPIELGLVPKEFRGAHFDVITVNGNETSITTEMGHKWKLWQAVRELYSNAIDEGLIAFETTDVLLPQPGQTDIFIENNENLQEFIDTMKSYFAEGKTVLYKDQGNIIYAKHSAESTVNIYRKGIKCFESLRYSPFDYSLYDISINEDRIINDMWDLNRFIGDLIINCTNSNILSEILSTLNNSCSFENTVFESSAIKWPYKIVNKKAWLDAIGDRYVCTTDLAGWVSKDIVNQTLFVPTPLYKWLLNNFEEVKSALNLKGDKVLYEEIDHTPLINNTFKKVNDFFTECNYPISIEIKAARFAKKYIQGHFEGGCIYINENTISKGIQAVVAVVLDKWIDSKYDSDKYTSSNHSEIFRDEFITYMKTINAINI